MGEGGGYLPAPWVRWRGIDGETRVVNVGPDRYEELTGVSKPKQVVQNALSDMVMRGGPSVWEGSYGDPGYRAPGAGETWKRLGSMALDFAPIVGDIKSGQEAITGKDLVTGEELGGWERLFAGVGALPFIPGLAGEIKAFHGSPYKFEKFSAAKIGSGEGAQSFGYGLYFTSEKDIAKHYAELGFGKTMKPVVKAMPDIMANREYGYLKNDLEGAWGNLTDQQVVTEIKNTLQFPSKSKFSVDADKIIEQNREGFEKIFEMAKSNQNLYSVTLHKGKKPGEYDYLKWDEIISNDINSKIEAQLRKENKLDQFKKSVGNISPYGNEIYHELSFLLGSDKEASLFLLRAGIDGIEYPAGTLSGTKSTAKNYVVFDENAVTIESPKSKIKPSVDLMSSIRSFQPPGQSRALVSISELRDKLGMPKEEFDRQILQLAQDEKVFLHEHDSAASLSQAERDKLVSIEDPRAYWGGRTYYVGVVPK